MAQKLCVSYFTSSKSGRFPATVVSSSTLFLCFSDKGARGESFTSHRLSFSLISLEYVESPTWAAMLALWTEVHCCLENCTAFLAGKRFPHENKMAAELSTLVSSFLESKPEKYAPFFLECVDSKQHLGEEVSIYHNPFYGLMFSQVFLKSVFISIPRVVLHTYSKVWKWSHNLISNVFP